MYMEFHLFIFIVHIQVELMDTEFMVKGGALSAYKNKFKSKKSFKVILSALFSCFFYFPFGYYYLTVPIRIIPPTHHLVNSLSPSSRVDALPIAFDSLRLTAFPVRFALTTTNRKCPLPPISTLPRPRLLIVFRQLPRVPRESHFSLLT